MARHRVTDLVKDSAVANDLIERMNAWARGQHSGETQYPTEWRMVPPDVWATRKTAGRLSKIVGKRNADLEQSDPQLYADLMAALNWAQIRRQGLLDGNGNLVMTTSRARQKEAVGRARKAGNNKLHEQRKALGFTKMPTHEQRVAVLQRLVKVSANISTTMRAPAILGMGLRILCSAWDVRQADLAALLGVASPTVNSVLVGRVVYSDREFDPYVRAFAQLAKRPLEDVLTRAYAIGAAVLADTSLVSVEVTDVPVITDGPDAVPTGAGAQGPAES